MKIELQWVERVTGRRVNNEGRWEPTYTPYLQYRYQNDPSQSTKSKIKWSEWTDVPTVREETT